MFLLYVFGSTCLFGSLMLGVVLTVFIELASVPTGRIFDAVEPLWRSRNEDEREALLDDLIVVNRELRDVHTEIESLDNGGQVSDQELVDLSGAVHVGKMDAGDDLSKGADNRPTEVNQEWLSLEIPAVDMGTGTSTIRVNLPEGQGEDSGPMGPMAPAPMAPQAGAPQERVCGWI